MKESLVHEFVQLFWVGWIGCDDGDGEDRNKVSHLSTKLILKLSNNRMPRRDLSI